MFFHGSFTVLSLPFQITNHSKGDIPMLLFFSFFIFFTFSLLVFSFSLYKRLKKIESEHHQQLISKPIETDPVGIEHYLTDNSTSFEVPADDFDSDKEEEQGKRKKKKGKKKRLNCCEEEEQELTILYPFTSSSSVMQREIKQQYDELIKCNQSKELTLAQVRQFANCLINARSKLQHKADVIHRKFTITKALLYKADRSSFDRLRQQIYKLELEQKRLEEDTFVYNWLQQQLKFSPAYKKMLEIGTCMELMAKSEKAAENTDHEFTDITFEELLAQEKKDSFWQRNGKLRSCSS